MNGRQSEEFTPAQSHPTIVHLRERLASLTPTDAPRRPESRLAAVAALLRVRREPELLFIKRADAHGDPWSGHIALPGGRYEPNDATLRHTALRETMEELSIDVEAVGQVLGRLDDLAPNSPRLPPVIIRPFVALVQPVLTIVRSREVADAFWIPVAQLMSPEAQGEHVLDSTGAHVRFPAFRIGTHVIWGITERIVRQLLALVDSP